MGKNIAILAFFPKSVQKNLVVCGFCRKFAKEFTRNKIKKNAENKKLIG